MKLLSTYVGRPKEVPYQGKTVTTSIFKEEVFGSIKVNFLNLEGDQQSDLKVHGGTNKAVYAYPFEHYAFWEEKRSDLKFQAGLFGENLSITGLDEDSVSVGDVFRIGSVVFEATSPRLPCFKLGIKMNDPSFIRDFMQAERTGFYFKVLEEGVLEAGNAIERVSEDPYQLSIREVTRLYTVERENKALLEKAINTPSLPSDWVEFFQKKLQQLKK